MVTENCRIDGKLWYTVLFSGVQVEKGCVSQLLRCNVKYKKSAKMPI